MKRSMPILLVLLVACSQFSIRSSYDPAATFGQLHTYGWLPLDEADGADQRLLDRYLDKRLRTAVGTELDAKGYAPATAAAPDFLLNYRLVTEPGEAARGGRAGIPYTSAWVGWQGAETFYRESFDTGTLYIAVIDGRSRRLVWLGAAQARLLSNASLERKARRVDAVAHKILEEFPPKGTDARAAR